MGPDGKWMGNWRYSWEPKGGSFPKDHRLCPPRWRNPALLLGATPGAFRPHPLRPTAIGSSTVNSED